MNSQQAEPKEVNGEAAMTTVQVDATSESPFKAELPGAVVEDTGTPPPMGMRGWGFHRRRCCARSRAAPLAVSRAGLMGVHVGALVDLVDHRRSEAKIFV
jgi:hypothetical protein